MRMRARLPLPSFALAVLALIGLSWSTAPQAAAQDEVLSVDAFNAAPGRYDGREVTVRGFVTFEDYGQALFADREAYLASDYGRSIPIVAPDQLIVIRESFERTIVELTGTYEHGCTRETVFCSAHPSQGRLIVSGIKGIEVPGGGTMTRSPTIDTPFHNLQWADDAPSEDPVLVGRVNAVFDAIAQRNVTGLLQLTNPEVRGFLETSLNFQSTNTDSRARWLLFDGPQNWADRLSNAPERSQPLIARFPSPALVEDVTVGCVCLAEECSIPSRPNGVIYTRQFDPLLCLSFERDAMGTWWLDPGILTQPDARDPGTRDFGGAYAYPQDGGALAYTHPPRPGSAVHTALFERPRPRTVWAMGAGRVPLPAVYRSPRMDVYVIERSGGEASLRLLKRATDQVAALDDPADRNSAVMPTDPSEEAAGESGLTTARAAKPKIVPHTKK